MTRARVLPPALRSCAVAVLLLALAAPSPAGQVLRLSRSSIDSGAGAASGGDFSVTGSIGQPDPGVASDGTWSVHGGFWASAAPAGTPLIFADGFEATGGTP